MSPIPWRAAVLKALEEDGAFRDATCALVGAARIRGRVVARQDMVVCGLPAVADVFRRLGSRCSPCVKDGHGARRGTVLAVVTGPAGRVLAGERTALNFLQRLSGIATLTRAFVERAKPVPIYDTRKTAPGLRAFEKYAVRCGGGTNHRMGLDDQILIKDNHIAAIGDLEELRERIHALKGGGRRIEIEADTLDQALFFATFPIDILMFDNFAPAALRRAVGRVRAIRPDLELEASGGVTLENVRAYARTGVDRISVGAITHSAPAADLSLEL